MRDGLIRETSPNRLSIVQGGNHIIFRLFGAFFFLPGLFVMALALGLVPMDEPPPPLWGAGAFVLLIGFVFTLAGFWRLVQKFTVEIDLLRREFVFTTAPFPSSKTILQVPFTDIEGFTLIADKDGETSSYSYRVKAITRNSAPLNIFSSLKLPDSVGVATLIGQKTGLEVKDQTLGTDRILTPADATRSQQPPKEADPVSIDDDRFREIPSMDAAVKLMQTEYRGVTAFKAIYPKAYIHRFLVCAVLLFINYKLTNFEYGRIIGDMITEWETPKYGRLPLIGFALLFLLTLILPLYGLLKEHFSKNRYSLIQIRGDSVSIFEMGRLQHNAHRYKIDVELSRTEILAVSAKIAGPETWKIAKLENCLQIRTPEKVLRCFHGMNGNHLEIVRDALIKFVQKN